MGSYANLAERLNALINLGFQHVALARVMMTPVLEDRMKRISTLTVCQIFNILKHIYHFAF